MSTEQVEQRHDPQPAALSSAEEASPAGSTNWLRWLAVAALLGLLASGYVVFGDDLNLSRLAEHEQALRHWRVERPLVTASTALVAYAVVAGMSLPGAAAMTLFCGWYFGPLVGLVIVSFGSTAGATIAFGVSRTLLRSWVSRRMGPRVRRFDDELARNGPYYLFTLRLVPVVPFFVINLVMGLTRIRTVTFWWVSQLGMLPGTAAYVYAGSTVPTLAALAEDGPGRVVSWQMLLAFALLGIMPLLLRMLTDWLNRWREAPAT